MFTGLESPTHLLLLLLIILLLFGAKRLPEVGRILGQGIKEFKEELNSNKEVLEKNQKEKRPEDIDRVAEIVPAAPGVLEDLHALTVVLSLGWISLGVTRPVGDGES